MYSAAEILLIVSPYTGANYKLRKSDSGAICYGGVAPNYQYFL